MKRFFGVAVFTLFFSVSAHAQAPMTAGSLNGGARPLPVYPTLSNTMTSDGGSQNFTPSSFMNYNQALAEGQAALKAHSKSLGEVAKESKAVDKPKSKMVAVQDADGRMIYVQTH